MAYILFSSLSFISDEYVTSEDNCKDCTCTEKGIKCYERDCPARPPHCGHFVVPENECCGVCKGIVVQQSYGTHIVSIVYKQTPIYKYNSRMVALSKALSLKWIKNNLLYDCIN